MYENLIVTPSPHIHSGNGISRIMRDVVIALLPVIAFSIYQYGWNALLLYIGCVASTILAEWLWCAITKRPVTVYDGSAVVTGVILALSLPPHFPVWMAAIGGFFAIMIVKMPFGGLGRNFMNPALAARAALMASWPTAMTTFIPPLGAVDALSTATPLVEIAAGKPLPLLPLALGQYSGSLGEAASLVLLLGALYLLLRGVIHWRVPLGFMTTVFVIGCVFGHTGSFISDGLRQLLTGGVILSACFMATDYASSPINPVAQWVFAIGCGLITMIIRLWGAYPEGVTYAVLLMNVAAPLLDRWLRPKRFGGERRGGEAA